MSASSKISNSLKNYLYLHLIIFIWGFTAVLISLINIDAIPMVWFRMSLASILLLLYLIIVRKKLRLNLKTFKTFLIGGIIIALHWVMFFMSIKTSNVSVTLVMVSTGAFFAALLEPLFFRRKINLLEICLGIIVIVGLYIIFNIEGDYTLGIIYGLIASFLSALFSVFNGKRVQSHDPLVMSFYQLFFGVLFITVLLFFIGDFSKISFRLSFWDWFFLFLLSSICTAYAFSASVKVLKILSPYTVMLTINLEPVYGIIIALLVFPEKEKMPTNFYFGAVIVLLSVLLNGVLKNKKQLIKPFKKSKIT